MLCGSTRWSWARSCCREAEPGIHQSIPSAGRRSRVSASRYRRASGDRAAASKGEVDLDIFGQTASVRVKRGTARPGSPGWAEAMVQAKGQAERYAKALPVAHGWPPFLLVADIGYCIEVYADFTGTEKTYAQFPDRSRYRIMLDDLRDEDIRTGRSGTINCGKLPFRQTVAKFRSSPALHFLICEQKCFYPVRLDRC